MPVEEQDANTVHQTIRCSAPSSSLFAVEPDCYSSAHMNAWILDADSMLLSVSLIPDSCMLHMVRGAATIFYARRDKIILLKVTITAAAAAVAVASGRSSCE